MTEPTADLPSDGPTLPDDRREDPPPAASSWVQELDPPATEAERQVQETIRSVSRLEESN
jgi:hypothetical protein